MPFVSGSTSTRSSSVVAAPPTPKAAASGPPARHTFALGRRLSPAPTPVLVLALTAFAIVTGEALPVGLLGQMADDLRVSPSRIGLVISGYAVVAAVSAIPTVRLTARLERRAVLVWAGLVFSVSYLVAAVAPSAAVLFGARAIAALAHSLFFGIAAAAAVRLAPEGRKARAAGTVSVGAASAFVAGVPLVTALGQHAGWRVASAVLGGVGLLLTAACLRVLPLMAAEPPTTGGGDGGIAQVLRSRRLRLVLGLTAAYVVAHFIAYTFLQPYLDARAHVSGASLTTMLFVFGAASVAGSVAATRLADRRPASVAVAGAVLFAAALGGLFAAGDHPLLMTVPVVAWAAGFSALAVSTQIASLRCAAGRGRETAVALYGTVFQVAIVAGSAAASALVGRGLLTVLPVPAAGLAAASAVAIALSRRVFSAR